MEGRFNYDRCLKIIPCCIFVFLIFNFIFNLGYFSLMGIKFASLLEIRDYYEGTAPLITFTILIFLGFVNVLLYSENINSSFKFIKQLVINIPLYIRAKIKYRFLLIFHYKKFSYNDKREMASIHKALKKAKLISPEARKGLVGFFSLVCLLLSPFVQFYIFAYNISKITFWILSILYLLLIIFYVFFKNPVVKITSAIFLIPCIIFTLGFWAFLRDYKTTGTEVLINNTQKYLLLRPIAKGAILKDDKNIMFYFWNNVSYIEKKANTEIHLEYNKSTMLQYNL